MINCLIIDDEPASREILETYIQDTTELTLFCSCKNAIEANEKLKQFHNIDVLLLDINMPKLNGMDFYKSLINPPLVIFTTAYPEYALDGFEVDAIDYLLKPFSYSRFLKAINKVENKIKTDDTDSNSYISLKADKRTYRLLLEDITRLESVGDYVKVFYLDKNIMVHDTMQNLLKKLPSSNFIRTHKSHAINFMKLESVEGNLIHLNNTKVPIGASYKKEIDKRINEG